MSISGSIQCLSKSFMTIAYLISYLVTISFQEYKAFMSGQLQLTLSVQLIHNSSNTTTKLWHINLNAARAAYLFCDFD